MRPWLPVVLVAVGAAVFLVYGSLSGPKSPPELDARVSTTLVPGLVASVTDGDTIRLADNRRIRLVQIDAPELPEGECYAEEATSELERLAPIGTEVTLHTDRRLGMKDEHGRFLAYVFKGKENVNLRLVGLGAAAPYFYRRTRGRYADELLASAQRAKADRRGLWGACPGTRLNPTRRVDTGR
jgi:endonuclease YncB( thermonuclease family)